MQKILDAAIIEFSQYGFQGTSTQAIAERAELKKSALHYYIEDKEALYSQVLAQVLATWRDFMTFGDHEELSPRDELTRFVKLKLNFAFEHPQLSRIFTMELLSGAERLEAYWPQALENTYDKVEHIKGWINQGAMRKLDGRLLIMHIWALTQYYSDYTPQAERVLDGKLSDPALRQQIEDELVTFVLMGCGMLAAD